MIDLEKYKLSKLVKEEGYKLLEYQKLLQDNYRNDKTKIPLDVEHLYYNMTLEKKSDKQITRDKYIEIMNEFYERIDRDYAIHKNSLLLTKITIANHLYSKRLQKDMISIDTLNKYLVLFEKYIYKSLVDPGEMIGIQSSTSLSAAVTQATLDTFHMAGVGNKTKVVQDLKSLNGILNLTKTKENNIKTIYSIIYFTDQNHIDDTMKLLRKNILDKFITVMQIIYDPKFLQQDTVVDEDRNMIKKYFRIRRVLENITNVSIRIVFDKKVMYKNRVSIDDIVTTIYENFENIDILALNENNIRIFMEKGHEVLFSKLPGLQITGISGINGSTLDEVDIIEYDNDRNKKEYKEKVLYTEGSNLLEVYKLPYVDRERTISNDINEVTSIFGKEVGRQIYIERLTSLLKSNGASINYQHMHLLGDFITHGKKMIKISRNGIPDIPSSEPFQKISFEDIERSIKSSAILGTVDHLRSVASNVMTTQIGEYAGGIFTIQV